MSFIYFNFPFFPIFDFYFYSMKRLNFSLLFFILVVVIISCKEKTHTPKVIYESPRIEKPDSEAQDTEYQIAELPIAFNNVDFLIHPIGQIRISNSNKFSNKNESISYSLSNSLDYDIQGIMDNVLFQEKSQDSLIALTDERVMISRINFLYNHFIKSKKSIFVYEVYDEDSNKDGKIDFNDVKSLFLSEKMGTKFTKVSVNRQEMIDWQYYESIDRLYFRTVEDINKNGRFDSTDQMHYYYITLSDSSYTPKSYNPIK